MCTLGIKLIKINIKNPRERQRVQRGLTETGTETQIKRDREQFREKLADPDKG